MGARSVHDDFAPRQAAPTGSYDRRRTEIFVLTFVGYVACYLVRNNTAVASGLLVVEEGWTPLDVGFVLTGFTVTYGLAKLVMGVVVDRSSLRVGYGSALIASAVVCIAMGFVPDVVAMAAAMAVIGLAQGVCAPASLATLGAWYPPWQRASRVAVWNTSQNVGAALLPLIASGAMLLLGVQHWSLAYWVPGLLALAAGSGCCDAAATGPGARASRRCRNATGRRRCRRCAARPRRPIGGWCASTCWATGSCSPWRC